MFKPKSVIKGEGVWEITAEEMEKLGKVSAFIEKDPAFRKKMMENAPMALIEKGIKLPKELIPKNIDYKVIYSNSTNDDSWIRVREIEF